MAELRVIKASLRFSSSESLSIVVSMLVIMGLRASSNVSSASVNAKRSA